MSNVTVKKSDPPETVEILAEAVIRISSGFTRLKESGLNYKAIVILIQAETKISRRDIEAVLNALPRLSGWYCRKP